MDQRSHAKQNIRTMEKVRRQGRARPGIDSRTAQPAGDSLDVRIVDEKPDYLVCVFLDVFDERPTTLTEVTDTSSTNRDLIDVAKPTEFRRNHLAGESRPNKDDEVLEYSYNDVNGTDRTVELDPGGGDPVITEDQVVNPPYISEVTIDSVIYAGSYITIKTIRNGTGVQNDAGDDLFFVDENNSPGRAWAEKDLA